MTRRWRRVIVVALFVLALQQLGSAAYINAKAVVAQLLIAGAWQKTLLTDGQPNKPWPWADTWPVARLKVPAEGVDLYVLHGAQGNSLAFGPGYEAASASLGSPGLSLIGGHRDTHFAFLERLQQNTEITLELPNGEHQLYRVNGTAVVNSQRDPVPQAEGDKSELLLVTCYPFRNWRAGGPLRYLVSAASQSYEL